MVELSSGPNEATKRRPELAEQIEYRGGDIFINLFDKGKKRNVVPDPDDASKTIERPTAYAKLHEFDNFFYIKHIWVDDKYRELGISSDQLHPKIKQFLDSQGVPKKFGLRYSERSYDRKEPDAIQRLGWQPLSFRPWFIYVPPGSSLPPEEKQLDMILMASPEYAEYLPSGYSRGVTLIDTIVGTALLALVFVGITGAFQLSVDIVTNNKARAGAIALANERQEYIRSLPYESVGVVGGIPAGVIAATEQLSLNNISYTRRTIIVYGDDPKDGSGIADTNANPADYKAVKTEVSWIPRTGGLRKIFLTSRVSPVGVEQAVPGGTLALTVLNAASAPVQNAQVTIINNTTNPVVNMALLSDPDGLVTVIGAPASAGYQITVTRDGYSTAKTYGATAENTNPTPGHLTVALNQTTSFPFSIDLVSIKNVQTFEPVKTTQTTDSFADATNIATTTNSEVASGVLHLVSAPGPYSSPGEARSTPIAPAYLVRWRSFDWVDARPAQTNIVYRVYNGDGTELIPDQQLPGNSSGFGVPPVSLLNVSTTTYPSISLHASLGTSNASETPEVQSWEVSHDVGPLPLPNITFGLQGTKTIGTGPLGPIYKYSTTTLSTGPTAGVGLGTMEWDTYTTTIDSLTGYDIASSCTPQPESLAPNEYQVTKLILAPHTTNSLLVDVKGNNVLIANATVNLYRAGYNATLTTDPCGQVFFSGLSAGTPGGGNPYSITVTAPGFTAYTATDVSVSGTSRLSIVLN